MGRYGEIWGDIIPSLKMSVREHIAAPMHLPTSPHISPYLPYQVRKEIGGLAIPDGIVAVSGTRAPLPPPASPAP